MFKNLNADNIGIRINISISIQYFLQIFSINFLFSWHPAVKHMSLSQSLNRKNGVQNEWQSYDQSHSRNYDCDCTVFKFHKTDENRLPIIASDP